MNNELKLYNKRYKILDAIEYITLADSFVKNKIGSGHGEAKLYVGNESERLFNFFQDFNCKCFFTKKDFVKFLMDSESEYLNPQQDYIKKEEMANRYTNLLDTVRNFSDEILPFELYRVDVNPRVYTNSKSIYYNFMREMGLPNISYLSVLKLETKSNEIVYYFKIFLDYKPDIISYSMPEEEKQTNIIKNSILSDKKKERLIKSRVGQGEYRNKLLD